MNHRIIPETTSCSLHLLAMAFMLCDHLWATVIPGNEWLTCVGRLAFPIFAFLLVEGYFHTHSLKRYAGRLFLFALLSEVPFDLVMGSTVFYPVHQNVLWTFLIGLGLIACNEWARGKGQLWLRGLTAAATVILGFLLGLVSFADFHFAGVFMVLTFYFFRGRRWWNRLGQLLAMAFINLEILGGLSYPVSLGGFSFFFPQQGFALLSLPLIWLYRGRQGYHSRAFQYACYAFYPVHLFLLWLLQGVLT
ncbi:TraX family protein [Dysosmobacter sp.]|uniref:TraX family protein n=1 Tax=Dysosmobacter sp. TaxID=2591382 RepID=UPI002A8F8FF1|nr:TraX family protein [Dysosmobacter sp.]MDY3281602.1 TraX family protein [Dysosmobacter sp.]